MSTLKVNKIQDTTGDDALTFDSSGNTTVNQTLTSTSANITTGGTHSLTISDGDLVVGTAGHGIDFSAGSHATNMSSELLDDYEEGEFTVTFTSTGGGTLTVGSTNNHFKYTKIGNRVFITGMVDCSAHSSATGELRLNSLPFTVINDGEASNAHHIGFIYFRGGDSTPGSTGNYGDFPVKWAVNTNGTTMTATAIYGGLTDSGSTNVAQYIGESTFISLSFHYVTA